MFHKYIFLLNVICVFQLYPMLFQDYPGLKDIIPSIAMLLDYSSMMSLKKTCRMCNDAYTQEFILNESDITALSAVNDEKCGDLMLTHCAKFNKKALFERLWNIQGQENKDKRIHALILLHNIPANDLEIIRKIYKGNIENAFDKATRLQEQRNKKLAQVIYSGNITATQILLVNNADPNMLFGTDDSLLHYTAKIGDAAKTQLLIQYGANVHKKDFKNNTPLHYAAIAGSLHVAKILYRNGAIINAQNYYQETPLHKACEEGHYKVVRYLLKKGAAIDNLDLWGNTPLNVACRYGWVRTARLLLEKGAQVTIGKDNRSTAYWYKQQKITNLLEDYKVGPCLEERIMNSYKKNFPKHFFYTCCIPGILVALVELFLNTQ